ncbi:MAG: Rieske (2Fe-2S) protein [Saprospirales bacterium]|nr:Rieske (2Fe-2S) protein [Saprospirales bacterium]
MVTDSFIPQSDLPPFPNAWYVFALSSELASGKLIARRFAGQEVTVFRTECGNVAAVESYCPHLGAHFGYGGKVKGEVLQCPFHGFEFNGSGQCTATGYGTAVPPKTRLKTWPVREQNGFILVYHHVQGMDPDWEVPPIDTTEWTPLICRTYELNDHPQETTENSVDFGHFTYVHSYQAPRTIRDLEIKGPFLFTGYEVKRTFDVLGVKLGEYTLTFEPHVYGLGFSMVNVRVPVFGVEGRFWVLPTPTDERKLTLRLALRLKKWPTRLGALASKLLAYYILKNYAKDASMDFPIWENKRYLPVPALAEGDGPIWKYRRWARQFYGQPATIVTG